MVSIYQRVIREQRARVVRGAVAVARRRRRAAAVFIMVFMAIFMSMPPVSS